ncbi:MAG: hypothetical protein Tsb0013_17050 [Phycisphaerales bacterium]
MKYIAAAAVLGLAGAASANFEMMMQTRNFAGGQFTQDLNFMKAGEFSNLPLKGVIIELELTANGGEFAIDNDGAEGGTVEVTYGANASLSSSDITIPAIAVNPASTMMFVLAADDEQGGMGAPIFNPGGPDSAILPPLMNEMENLNLPLAPAFFAEFEGLGAFDISVAVDQAFNITGLGAVAFSGALLQTEGFVKITYLYSPAPGAAALAGIAGLAGIRRRRHA